MTRILDAYLWPHGRVHRLPVPEQTPTTLGALLRLPRMPLPGGAQELVWGRGLGGVYQHPVPELRGPWGWREDVRVSAELIRFAWFNRANPDDPDAPYVPDSRRFVMLGLVLVAGSPACLIAKCGREGDDWTRRWILDPDAFGELLRSQGVRRRKWAVCPRRPAKMVPARLDACVDWMLDDPWGVDPLAPLRWVGWT